MYIKVLMILGMVCEEYWMIMEKGELIGRLIKEKRKRKNEFIRVIVYF